MPSKMRGFGTARRPRCERIECRFGLQPTISDAWVWNGNGQRTLNVFY